MLFVFQEERQHTFWMKDMRFPLDMIWITAECTIADIIADVPNPPPDQKNGVLPTYSPSAPGTFVLELNAGVAAASGLQTGDKPKSSNSTPPRLLPLCRKTPGFRLSPEQRLVGFSKAITPFNDLRRCTLPARPLE